MYQYMSHYNQPGLPWEKYTSGLLRILSILHSIHHSSIQCFLNLITYFFSIQTPRIIPRESLCYQLLIIGETQDSVPRLFILYYIYDVVLFSIRPLKIIFNLIFRWLLHLFIQWLTQKLWISISQHKPNMHKTTWEF